MQQSVLLLLLLLFILCHIIDMSYFCTSSFSCSCIYTDLLVIQHFIAVHYSYWYFVHYIFYEVQFDVQFDEKPKATDLYRLYSWIVPEFFPWWKQLICQWQLVTCQWQLATCQWQLVTFQWQLTTCQWQLATCQLATCQFLILFSL